MVHTPSTTITIKVEASDIVIPDTGIAAEGQTFVNIP